MKNKEKKFDESYTKGFADGIKTNQADWLDRINTKIRYYNTNRNSGQAMERLNKAAVLEELMKEI